MDSNKKTKVILSVIGVSAILIPAVLLVVLTARNNNTVSESSGSRSIDQNAIEQKVKQVPKQNFVFASPASTSTPSAKPAEGSSSAK